MKLRTPLVFNDKVQPALLPDPGFEAEGMLVVAGWGRLSFGGPLPGVLMVSCLLSVLRDKIKLW